MAYEDRDFFDKNNDGESPIYVGIKYLVIIANQMNRVREVESYALNRQSYSDQMVWLNELKIFWDLVENRTGMEYSEKEIDLFEMDFSKSDFPKTVKKIQEKQKYKLWFGMIERMIEINYSRVKYQAEQVSEFTSNLYKSNKVVLAELSDCTRSLFRDANRRNLIMPKGMENMKDLAKNEWIDRDAKKEF
jgi:hypothetical protein